MIHQTIEQKIIHLRGTDGQYTSFFKYNFLEDELRSGWIVKHIHDNQALEYCMIILERGVKVEP